MYLIKWKPEREIQILKREVRKAIKLEIISHEDLKNHTLMNGKINDIECKRISDGRIPIWFIKDSPIYGAFAEAIEEIYQELIKDEKTI